MVINQDHVPVIGAEAGKRTTKVAESKSHAGSSKISSWGKSNREPQLMLLDAQNTPTIFSILRYKAKLLYGKGVSLGAAHDTDDQGNEMVKPIKDPKIEQFLKQSLFPQQIIRAVNSYPFFENPFAEWIMTRDRKQVYMVNFLKPHYCRWGVKDQQTNTIKELYVSGSWQGPTLPSDHTKIEAMDEYFPIESVLESGAMKLAYRFLDVSEDDKEYYNVPMWNAIRTSKWLSVAQKIPIFKDFLFLNQQSVKYHYEFAREYIEWKYKDFKELGQEARIAILKAERSAMDASLSGLEGAGKSVSSISHIDRQGKNIPGVVINPLNTKFGSGDYIEDMQEATAQMLLAAGLPPTLLGISAGQKSGSISGSDIRETYNMYVASQELDRIRILDPWYKAFEYNGYPSDIRLMWKYPIITTLDKGKETETKESNGAN